MTIGAYPADRVRRGRWILERRPAKNDLDPWRAYASLWEAEAGALDTPIPTATIFLTNRECPYRCLMCDLWRNTLNETVPPGAIPAQIRRALEDMPPDRPAPRQVKLYNAGSFFDPKAILEDDYADIAAAVRGMDRVIVESHPAFVVGRTLRFRDLLSAEGVDRLEVAIGLETVHEATLDRLNKRMTVASFREAAVLLAREDIALRVFLLVRPPFMSEHDGVEWACRSLEVAFECRAQVVCLIPTRGGNGAMEALAAQGQYKPPDLTSVEAAQEFGLSLGRGRVFSDLWDVERFYSCSCSPARAARLAAMNAGQRAPTRVVCERCGGGAA